MQSSSAPLRPLREAYHSTAEFSGYVRHCGPTAVTNLLLSLLPDPPPAKELFRRVAELGRRKLVYVNRELPLGLGGTSDALTGAYLRAALHQCGLKTVQIGLRRPLTERFARTALGRLLDSFSRGKYLEKGIRTAIIGKPNVGKSSLLNALLGYDRAIVTSVPGTTRDTLSERCTLGNVTLRLTDTAGVRESADAVEALGVERSRAAAEESVLCLAVLDRSRPLDGEDEAVIALAAAAPHRIAVVNKADLPPAWDSASLTGFDAVCEVSAREGTGLRGLSAAVEALFPLPEAETGEILTNARQAEVIARAHDFLTAARDARDEGYPPDAVLTECEGAMAALAELTGREIRADVTEGIFSRFCVGK